MPHPLYKSVFLPALLTALLSAAGSRAQTQAPVVTQSNFNVRVIASNLTSGNQQRYETSGLNILQGLKPDVIAVQEFNYSSTNGLGLNTPAAFQEMVRAIMGSNGYYFRESGAGYSIPNGIISRWPIGASNSWVDADSGVDNRGFAWARIDLPGTNPLYVASVHLKAVGTGNTAARRQAEAEQLTSLIQSSLPPSAFTNAFIIVAGDFNIDSPDEAALATFKTYLSDSPIPRDNTPSADADTNAGRDERYDYVLPSFTLASHQVPSVIGTRAFGNGLVFDSRSYGTYAPLADVFPVTSGDSGASMMQHLAVVKDFRLSATVTNYVTVPSPVVKLISTNILRWQGVSNLTYTVQWATSLNNWLMLGTAGSTTTNFFFTNSQPATSRKFYRVTWP